MIKKNVATFYKKAYYSINKTIVQTSYKKSYMWATEFLVFK